MFAATASLQPAKGVGIMNLADSNSFVAIHIHSLWLGAVHDPDKPRLCD